MSYFKFKKEAGYAAIVCIYAGLIFNPNYSTEEIMAIIMHEIGHNFQEAISGVNLWFTSFGKVADIVKLIAGIMNAMKEDVFGTGTLPYLQGGVVFNGCVEDPTVGERIYSPGHPDADANGYIRSSNVNAMVDMADAIMAQRAYEANLALVNISRSMAAKAVEIGR